ncbi:MAG: tetratricopeptide repeat protein [Planctomycetota bacterium]|jgi:tetratricopeptide (TPR) repeat protein
MIFMHYRILFIIALLLCLALPHTLSADIIVMKDGRAIRGKVISEDEKDVVVEVPGGRVVFSRKMVDYIEKEDDDVYLVNEADRLTMLGQYEDAIGYYKQALELAPSFEIQEKLDKCRALLGRQCIEERNLKRAERIFKILSETDKDAAKAGLEEIEKIRRNALNREKAADGYLKIRQYGEALEIFEEVAKDFPSRRGDLYKKMARCYTGLGDAALNAGEFDTAERVYDLALEYDPARLGLLERRWVIAKSRRIQALLAEKNYRGARDLAKEALSVVPNNKVLHFLLGDAYLGLGLETLAKEEYRRSAPGFVLTPSTTVMDLRREALGRVLTPEAAKKLAEDEKKWKEILPGDTRRLETENFVIHHRNDYVAKRVAEAAEFHYRRILASLDYLGRMEKWKEKCPIHIYPTIEEFHLKSKRPTWSAAVARYKTTRGALVEQDIICYQAAGDLLDSAIPHEISHLLLIRIMGYDTRTPLWAYEGIAISFENTMKVEYYRRFLSAEYERENHVELAKLLEMKDYPEKDEVILFYAQSAMLAQYLLRRGGYPKLIETLELIKGGRDSASALKKVYGSRNVQAIETGYLGALKK